MLKGSAFTRPLLIAATISLTPSLCWAFQSHPAPEGLYGHQISHLIFAVAMGFLIYWLESNEFSKQEGWRLIQLACALFVLWNLVAVVGHWVEDRIPNETVSAEPDWRQRINLSVSPLAPAYYLLKLDHLVCVPAMLCLLLGIRSLYRNALLEERRDD